MKSILNQIVTFPCRYVKYIQDSERLLLLSAVCLDKKLDDPGIWETDAFTTAVSKYLAALHENPKMLDGMPNVKKNLFWTLLLSKFKLLKISRDEVRRLIRIYGMMKESIAMFPSYVRKKLPPSIPIAVFHIWKLFMQPKIFLAS